MKNHPLALDHETLHNETPQTIISLAAEFGFQGVCLRLVRGRSDNLPIIGDTPMRREVRQMSREYGIPVLSCETAYIGPRFEPESHRDMLETCAFLEVPCVSIIMIDTDLSRAGDNFRAFAELASGMGVTPIIETAPLAALKTSSQALDFIKVNHVEPAGIGIDALHVVRSQTPPASIADIAPDKVRYFQINDGPYERPQQEWVDEAYGDRIAPGEGEFPLVEMVDALPDGVPIGIEAPNRAAWARLTPRDFVKSLADSTRKVLGSRLTSS